jgi:hypothetical protein
MRRFPLLEMIFLRFFSRSDQKSVFMLTVFPASLEEEEDEEELPSVPSPAL